MTNYRWVITTMLFFATTINYMDRQVLSLTWKDFIAPEFHWTNNEVPSPAFFRYFMPYLCFLQVNWWIGLIQKKDFCGLSAFGRSELCFTLFAELLLPDFLQVNGPGVSPKRKTLSPLLAMWGQSFHSASHCLSLRVWFWQLAKQEISLHQ